VTTTKIGHKVADDTDLELSKEGNADEYDYEVSMKV